MEDGKITIITHNDINASQPSNINLRLKEHQLKLLNKCLELEKHEIIYSKNNNIKINTKMGIIGDLVGSGKSLVMLSICTIPIQIIPNPYFKQHLDIFSTENSSLSNKAIIKNINIIVVPHVIFTQWKTYIEDFTNITTEFVRVSKDIGKLNFDKELILITSSQYNDFAFLVNEGNFWFSRIFFDEADSISIPNCRKINAQFYWFVTSSILNLLYPKGYLKWNPITRRHNKDIIGIRRNGFIKDTFLGLKDLDITKDIYLKNDNELVKQSFALPDIKVIKCICKNTAILNILNNLVSENIQQMICAGDIEGAIRSINIEKTDEDNLIKVVCNNLYDEIENHYIDLEAIRKKNYINKEAQENHIIKIKKEIFELEYKIDSIRTRIKETNMDPITFCEIDNPTIVKCCNQVFDFESITIYLTSTNTPKCPMCRTSITKESLLIVSSNDEEECKTDTEEEKNIIKEHIFEDNDKPENLEYILSNIDNESKIIIFTEHDGTYNTILSTLNKLNIECKQIKGNSFSINKTLEWYKEIGNPKILFLNANYCGAGVNLEMTTDLIIYHKMDKSLETQVIGRAQRPGRISPLNVYYLLYENE